MNKKQLIARMDNSPNKSVLLGYDTYPTKKQMRTKLTFSGRARMEEQLAGMRKYPELLDMMYTTLYKAGMVDDTGAVIVPDYVNELYDKLNEIEITYCYGRPSPEGLSDIKVLCSTIPFIYHAELYDGLTLNKMGKVHKMTCETLMRMAEIGNDLLRVVN